MRSPAKIYRLPVLLLLVLVGSGERRDAVAADKFLEEENRARAEAVKAYTDGKFDEATQRLNEAISRRMSGTRPDNPEDQKLLKQISHEKAQRKRAREFEQSERFEAAVKAVEELMDDRRKRVPMDGAAYDDQRWLQDLKNKMNAQKSRGGDVLAEYQDRWFDRSNEFPESGRLHSELAAKSAELEKLVAKLGDQHRDSVRLRREIDKSRKDLDEKLKNLHAHIEEQRNDYREGKLDEAEVNAEIVLDLRREIYGPEDLTVAISAVEAAQIELNKGELYGFSEERFEEAFSIFKKLYGAKHWRVRDIDVQKREVDELRTTFPDVVKRAPRIRANLAQISAAMSAGNPFAGLDIVSKDLDFLEQMAPTRPLTLTARALLVKASALRSLGRLDEAILAQARGIQMLQELFGDEHPEIIKALEEQTSAFLRIGDLAQAETNARRARAECEVVWGTEHIEYAECLRGLAAVLIELNQSQEARPIVVQALKIAERDFQRYSLDWTRSFRLLAEVEFRIGHWQNARDYFAHTLKNLEDEFSPEYVLTLSRLAAAENRLGESEKAESLWVKAMELSAKIRPEGHPDHAVLLANAARMYQDRENYEKAATLFEEALRYSRKQLDTTFNVLSERQQLTMTRATSEMLIDYLNVAHHSKRPAAEVYALAVAWKGAIIARQQQNRSVPADPMTAELRSKLDDLSRRIASLALATPDPAQKDSQNRLLSRWTAEKDRLEGELAARGVKTRRAIGLPEVQAALPAGTVLVDFYQCRDIVPVPNSKDRGYQAKVFAFIVAPGGNVEQIDLGPLAPIEQAAEQWRQTIVRGGGGIARGLALLPQKTDAAAAPQSTLRDLLWKPLESHLDPNAVVLLSPEGALSRIPFAALPGSKPDKYLIEERSLVLVPSPILLPDLLAPKADREPADAVLLIGDVDFRNASGKVAQAETNPIPAAAPARSTRTQFLPLPGTDRETREIQQLQAKTFRKEGTRLTGVDATETSFRSLAPKARILHLATHGYFVDPRDARTSSSGNDQGASTSSTVLHPGLASGLALAGANVGATASHDPEAPGDDGILTGLEVASLDLSGTDLVVLSACETGLGTSAGGEGMMSLQRSFQVAGVKTSITSLWKVDDSATQALMIEFYRNLWEKRLGTLEALHRAQLSMIEKYDPKAQTLRDRGLRLVDTPAASAIEQRLSPYFWAAFTLSGDWR